MKRLLVLAVAFMMATSCSTLLSSLGQVKITGAGESDALSNAEVASGLKGALNVGIENAVYQLCKENGFYGDALFKILLPEEASVIVDNIKYIPGGEQLVEKAVLALNRAAEDAVTQATPIFANAITSMTISDAMNILFGAENAATSYLQKSTYTSLESAFMPKVSTSLGKPLVAGMSASEVWNQLTSLYNKAANSIIGSAAGLTPVNIALENYVTEKALDALFVKIADTEKSIREDPAARVTSILQRVFGQLDKKKSTL